MSSRDGTKASLICAKVEQNRYLTEPCLYTVNATFIQEQKPRLWSARTMAMVHVVPAQIFQAAQRLSSVR